MFKDEYPQDAEDYRVQGCDHSQIIFLWLVSGSTLAGLSINAPFKKVHDLCQDKRNDVWNIGLLPGLKSCFVSHTSLWTVQWIWEEHVSTLSCSSLHIALKVDLVYPWTCVSEPCLSCNILNSNNVIIVQGYLLNASWQYLFPCPKGETNIAQVAILWWLSSFTTTAINLLTSFSYYQEREYILCWMSV